PICSCRFSTIRRSSTCCCRTSCGGSWPPRLPMVCSTSRRRWSSWLYMITSLSTMATTRSRDWNCAWAVEASRAAPSSSRRRQSESLFFTFTVTLDALVEEGFGLATQHVAEALEDDLQEDAAIRLFVVVRIQADFVVVDPV